MSHAILTLVLAAAVAPAAVAQPNINRLRSRRAYPEIPLPANAEQLLKSIQSEQMPVPPDFAKEVRDVVEKLRAMIRTISPRISGKRTKTSRTWRSSTSARNPT